MIDWNFVLTFIVAFGIYEVCKTLIAVSVAAIILLLKRDGL
jgi:hypothetical protein